MALTRKKGLVTRKTSDLVGGKEHQSLQHGARRVKGKPSFGNREGKKPRKCPPEEKKVPDTKKKKNSVIAPKKGASTWATGWDEKGSKEGTGKGCSFTKKGGCPVGGRGGKGLLWEKNQKGGRGRDRKKTRVHFL